MAAMSLDRSFDVGTSEDRYGDPRAGLNARVAAAVAHAVA